MKAICKLAGKKNVVAELNLDWPPHRFSTFKTEDKKIWQIIDFDPRPEPSAQEFNVVVIPWIPNPDDIETNPFLDF